MSYSKSSNPVEYIFSLLRQELNLGMSYNEFWKAWNMNIAAHQRFDTDAYCGYVHPKYNRKTSNKYNYPENDRADSHE